MIIITKAETVTMTIVVMVIVIISIVIFITTITVKERDPPLPPVQERIVTRDKLVSDRLVTGESRRNQVIGVERNSASNRRHIFLR